MHNVLAGPESLLGKVLVPPYPFILTILNLQVLGAFQPHISQLSLQHRYKFDSFVNRINTLLDVNQLTFVNFLVIKFIQLFLVGFQINPILKILSIKELLEIVVNLIITCELVLSNLIDFGCYLAGYQAFHIE